MDFCWNCSSDGHVSGLEIRCYHNYENVSLRSINNNVSKYKDACPTLTKNNWNLSKEQ